MLPIARTVAGLRVVEASLTSTQYPSRIARAAPTSECLLFACGTCLQHMDPLRSGLCGEFLLVVSWSFLVYGQELSCRPPP